MSLPTFGMSIERVDNEPRPAVPSDMSVVGLVGTAPDANAATYPLNMPVQIFSDDKAALTALGVNGTLPDAIQGINDQLGEMQVAARVVVVRVADNASAEAVISNIVGSSATKAGIWALLEAGPILGVIPRLIACPGYTSQRYRGLGTLVLGTQGSNLTEAPTVGFTGGGSDPGKVMPTAHVVLGTGADVGKVASLVVDTPGANLSGTLTVTFAGGGTDPGKTLPTATATIEMLANPVVAALPPVLNQLLGVAVCQGPATTLQDFIDWRETINSERIIPLETGVKVGTAATVRDAASRVLGIGARRDHEKGGKPFHSWARQPMHGIVGPNRPIRYSLTEGATEGQQILANNGGVILRGEAGVETAIASGGFMFVGTDTAAEDELWRFYSVVRGRDYIHLQCLKTLRDYLGRFNLTGQTIQAVLNTIKFILVDLKVNGNILGYEDPSFTPSLNSPENLRLGRITVNFAAEEAPVLRHIGIRSSRYRPALDSLLDDLIGQVGVGN